jgi:hypothetical protein
MQAKDNFCMLPSGESSAANCTHAIKYCVVPSRNLSWCFLCGMQRDSLVALRERRVNYYQIAPHSLLFALALLVNNAN